MLAKSLTLAPIAAATFTLLAASATAATDPFHDFSEKYRCPIADRLQRPYDAGDPAKDHNRFIVVGMPEKRYVQCLFHDNETRIL